MRVFGIGNFSDSIAHPIEPPERATLDSARDATPED
jgi:hypothetical protein